MEARLFDEKGRHKPVGEQSDILLKEFDKNDQNFYGVTALAHGGFMAMWSNRNESGALDIAARIFDEHGFARQSNNGLDFTLFTLDEPDLSDPTVSALIDGGFVLTWESDSSWPRNSESAGLRACIFNADGSPRTSGRSSFQSPLQIAAAR